MQIQPTRLAFGNNEQRLQHEAWLRTFPPEALAAMAPIAVNGWQEYRTGTYRPWNKLSLKQLFARFQHIKSALALGKQFEAVGEFNQRVIRLHIQRLKALATGNMKQWNDAMRSLSNLGEALATVLRERNFTAPPAKSGMSILAPTPDVTLHMQQKTSDDIPALKS